MRLLFTLFALAVSLRRMAIRLPAGFEERPLGDVKRTGALPGLAKIIDVLRPVTFGAARTSQEGGYSIQDAMTL
jgi:hypothetical protein